MQMLSQVTESITQLAKYPEFAVFYQEHVKDMQDAILDNEIAANSYKMKQVKSFNSVISQLNELTEELKLL